MSQAAAARGAFTGSAAQLWLSTVARVALGLVLLAASLLKIVHPQQAVEAVQAYQILPNAVAEYVGYGLPLVELALGVALILGLWTRLVAAATGVLMLVFITAVSSAWARGLSIDCGCFGGGGTVAPGQTRYWLEIGRDLLFVALAVWLVRFPLSRFSLDGHGRDARHGAGSDDWADDVGDNDIDDPAPDAADEIEEPRG